MQNEQAHKASSALLPCVIEWEWLKCSICFYGGKKMDVTGGTHIQTRILLRLVTKGLQRPQLHKCLLNVWHRKVKGILTRHFCCMCMYVMYVLVYVNVCLTHMCERVHVKVMPYSFLCSSLSHFWRSQIWWDSLASKLQVSTCLCPSSTGGYEYV